MIHINEVFDVNADLVIHPYGEDYFYIMEFNEVVVRQLFPVWQNLKPKLNSKKIKLLKPLIFHRFKLSDCDFTTRKLIDNNYYTFTTQMKLMSATGVSRKKLNVNSVVLHRAIQHGVDNPLCVMNIDIPGSDGDIFPLIPELFFAPVVARQSAFEGELKELKCRKTSTTLEVIPNAFWLHVVMIDKDKPVDKFIKEHEYLIVHEQIDHWMRFLVFEDPDNVLTANNDPEKFNNLINSIKGDVLPKVVEHLTARFLAESKKKRNEEFLKALSN